MAPAHAGAMFFRIKRRYFDPFIMNSRRQPAGRPRCYHSDMGASGVQVRNASVFSWRNSDLFHDRGNHMRRSSTSLVVGLAAGAAVLAAAPALAGDYGYYAYGPAPTPVSAYYLHHHHARQVAVPTTVYQPVTRAYTVPVRSYQNVVTNALVPVTAYQTVRTLHQVPVVTYQTVERYHTVPVRAYQQVQTINQVPVTSYATVHRTELQPTTAYQVYQQPFDCGCE